MYAYIYIYSCTVNCLDVCRYVLACHYRVLVLCLRICLSIMFNVLSIINVSITLKFVHVYLLLC